MLQITPYTKANECPKKENKDRRCENAEDSETKLSIMDTFSYSKSSLKKATWIYITYNNSM